MSDNKDKDPKQKPAPAAKDPGAAKKTPESAASAALKPAAGESAKAAAAGKPAPEKSDAKPSAPKRALREEFPPDEDEEESEEEPFADETEEEEGELALDPATLGATDTSERIILVVDEEGQRRSETVSIINQILPNAVIEVANDPEEALEMMEEGDFDTFVVNFLMPGYSSSPFVKAVANHPEHPLLIGFAADKMSDAVDPKKGLKIIPLKRLFDLDTSSSGEQAEGEAAEE